MEISANSYLISGDSDSIMKNNLKKLAYGNVVTEKYEESLNASNDCELYVKILAISSIAVAALGFLTFGVSAALLAVFPAIGALYFYAKKSSFKNIKPNKEQLDVIYRQINELLDTYYKIKSNLVAISFSKNHYDIADEEKTKAVELTKKIVCKLNDEKDEFLKEISEATQIAQEILKRQAPSQLDAHTWDELKDKCNQLIHGYAYISDRASVINKNYKIHDNPYVKLDFQKSEFYKYHCWQASGAELPENIKNKLRF